VTAARDADGKGPEDRYGRLPWFRPGDLTVEQRNYYDRLTSGPRSKASLVDARGRLKGAFNARLLDPPVGTAIEQLGAVLRFGTPALAGRQREIAILEVARAERSGYEWRAHSAAGLATGLRPEELDAILDGRDLDTFSPAETLTRQVAQALVTERDLADSLFAAAEQDLGLTALFDLISLVGHYQHTALALRVWRVPLDPDGTPFPDGEATAARCGH
jgi:alkylhydroperoxidase family enzyme